MPRGNPDNLRAAAQRKRAEATARAEAALAELVRDGRAITFRGLAKAAGVSVDFLYRSPLRGRVEELRAARRPAPTPLGAHDDIGDRQLVRRWPRNCASSSAATARNWASCDTRSPSPRAKTSSCADEWVAEPISRHPRLADTMNA